MCWCKCLSKSPGTGLQVTICLCHHWFSELKCQPSRVIHTMSLNKTRNCFQVSYLNVASYLIRDQLHYASPICVWRSPGKKPEYWGKLCVLKDSSWHWDEEWQISHRAESVGSGMWNHRLFSTNWIFSVFIFLYKRAFVKFPLTGRTWFIVSHGSWIWIAWR